MLKNILFWVVIAGLIAYGCQNNWFNWEAKGLKRFVNGVKSDIEYQRSLMPEEEPAIDDHEGQLTVEKGEKKVVRRSALGAVYGGR